MCSDTHLEMRGGVSVLPHLMLLAAAPRCPPGNQGGVNRVQAVGVEIPGTCTQGGGWLPGGAESREAHTTRASPAPCPRGSSSSEPHWLRSVRPADATLVPQRPEQMGREAGDHPALSQASGHSLTFCPPRRLWPAPLPFRLALCNSWRGRQEDTRHSTG